MRSIIILSLLMAATLAVNAQAIRKSGSKYVGASYSSLKHGSDFGVHYEQYFTKGFSYVLKVVYENSKVELTAYDTYRLDLGSNKSFSTALSDLYLNVGILGYFGQQVIKNDYYPQEDNFVYGIYLNPKIEYFIFENFSLALGVSSYLDFKSVFRNRHYSFSLYISKSF